MPEESTTFARGRIHRWTVAPIPRFRRESFNRETHRRVRRNKKSGWLTKTGSAGRQQERLGENSRFRPERGMSTPSISERSAAMSLTPQMPEPGNQVMHRMVYLMKAAITPADRNVPSNFPSAYRCGRAKFRFRPLSNR
jgi:hypothetical protein